MPTHLQDDVTKQRKPRKEEPQDNEQDRGTDDTEERACPGDRESPARAGLNSDVISHNAEFRIAL